MNTPIKWNASISAHVPALQAKWSEVRKGLRRVLVGYFILALLAVSGLFLVWYALTRPAIGPAAAQQALHPKAILAVGWALAGTGAVLWYWLVFSGQWRCLNYAPQRHAAKELLFCCFFCMLVAPACLAGGHFLRGSEDYLSVLEGLVSLRAETLLEQGTLLQLAGLLLFFLNLMLFSAFLRAVMKCLVPSGSVLLSQFFWFVAFLAGATAGLFWSAGLEVLLALSIGWGVCLLWHVILIHAAGVWTRRVLAESGGPGRLDEKHRPKPPSGLHYTYQRLKTR